MGLTGNGRPRPVHALSSSAYDLVQRCDAQCHGGSWRREAKSMMSNKCCGCYFLRLFTASLSCLPALNLTDLVAGIRIRSEV